MEVEKLRVQKVTKIMSHRDSKDKSVSYARCSEHKMHEQWLEFKKSSFKVIRRQQSSGWNQLNEMS